MQPVAPRHRRDGRRRIEALGHDPGLLLVGPAPPPANAGDHLHPAKAVGLRTSRTTMITHRSRPVRSARALHPRRCQPTRKVPVRRRLRSPAAPGRPSHPCPCGSRPVGLPKRNPHPGRDRDHVRSRTTSSTRRSAAASTSAPTRTTAGPSAISIRPLASARAVPSLLPSPRPARTREHHAPPVSRAAVARQRAGSRAVRSAGPPPRRSWSGSRLSATIQPSPRPSSAAVGRPR